MTQDKRGGSPSIIRHARYVTEAYTDPGQFSSPQEYLRAISEGLDELAELHGKTPPDLREVKWNT